MNLLPVGYQIKLYTLYAAFQHHTIDCQNCDQSQKTYHHGLADLFHSILQTHRADQNPHNHDQHHPKAHAPRVRKHMIELVRYPLGIQPLKIIYQKTVKITDHPACHRGIKHHDHIITQQCHITMKMPFTAHGL